LAISKTLYVTSRDEWRAWLANHHASESEIWLIYYKVHSGQPRIPYEDAVEEALCFGWIDSIVKRIDVQRYAQKFTPRRDCSTWSKSNIERARRLISEGRMTEVGLAKIDLAALGEEPRAKQGVHQHDIPGFVKQALMASPRAWKRFESLAASYRRNYIRWVMDAKREVTRERRLREVISVLEQNKKLGLK
jgi:uncharacterized protein YdeI (YjbR/CyaY-like superfamily)